MPAVSAVFAHPWVRRSRLGTSAGPSGWGRCRRSSPQRRAPPAAALTWPHSPDGKPPPRLLTPPPAPPPAPAPVGSQVIPLEILTRGKSLSSMVRRFTAMFYCLFLPPLFDSLGGFTVFMCQVRESVLARLLLLRGVARALLPLAHAERAAASLRRRGCCASRTPSSCGCGSPRRGATTSPRSSTSWRRALPRSRFRLSWPAPRRYPARCRARKPADGGSWRLGWRVRWVGAQVVEWVPFTDPPPRRRPTDVNLRKRIQQLADSPSGSPRAGGAGDESSAWEDWDIWGGGGLYRT